MLEISARFSPMPKTIEPSPYSGVPGSSFALARPRTILAVSGLLLALHLAASFLLPQHGAVTCLSIGCCYALACLVATTQALRVSGTMRLRWALAALGFALGILSLAITFYAESASRLPSQMAGLYDVALLLRGLPFLVAVSLSQLERSAAFQRLDFAQGLLATAVGCVAFLVSFPAPDGHFMPVYSVLAIDRILIANLVFAALASLRLLAKSRPRELRFFRSISLFLWANTLVTGFLNLVAIQEWNVPVGSPWFVLTDLPILAVAFACSLPSPPPPQFAGEQTHGFIASGASFLFPLGIFFMAATIMPQHHLIGLSVLALTFVLYGVRSTLLQSRLLATQEELRQTNDRIRHESLLDALTNIPNRRNFDLTLEREWRRAQRTGRALALLMLDVDRFKWLNDTYGHPVGDTCLQQIAALLRSSLGRGVDFAARYGGEEFAVLLVDTGIHGAGTVSEQIRQRIEAHPSAVVDGQTIRVTLSIGIAARVPTLAESPRSLVEAADQALYRAKKNGRNRVEIDPASVT